MWDVDNNDTCIGGDTCDRLGWTGGSPIASSYTVTFLTGANAASIAKQASLSYHVTAGYSLSSGTRVYGYTSVSNNTQYVANLVFNGTNTVSGSTDIGNDGLITIMGGPVHFAGTVNARQISVQNGDVNFNGNVTLDPAGSGLTFGSAQTVTFSGLASLTGNVNFAGYNGNLRLNNGSNVLGDITTDSGSSNSGIVTFGGDSTVFGHIGAADARIRQIDVNGNSYRTVTLFGMNYANLVDINAGGNLVIGDGDSTDGLDTTGTVGGRVDFNNTAGSVSLANLGTIRGQIVSTGGANAAGTAAVANEVNFFENGTMIGNIGTSASNRIGAVNVGSAAAGTVNMSGDLYAAQLNISSSSTLNITGDLTAATTLGTTGVDGQATLAVNQGDVNGPVSTAINGQGAFTLVGGTQTVTGQIGAPSKSLATVNAGANASSATLIGDVFATYLNVTGTGTVNLNGNFTGTSISYKADGTVRLAHDKTLHGVVINDTASPTVASGTFTFEQSGSMAMGRDIGASGASLKRVNIGAVGGVSAGTVTTDTIWATNTTINNDSTLNVREGKDINGAVTTATDNTGTLIMKGGVQSVTGAVGTAGVGLATVTAGFGGATTTFNGMVHATTLKYNGNNGTVVLKGTNDGVTDGLVGTVDFGAGGEGKLHIWGGVNLTAGADGIQFANANKARLYFDGSSIVTGVLGAASGSTAAHSTLGAIYAGVAEATVTFSDDVYVSGSTFHVLGTGGVINLQGDLYGPLVFDADGIVNVSNGKSIRNDGTVALGTVTTTVGNGTTGTLNYLGNTTLSNDLGASGAALKAVNFHSDGTVEAVTQTLNKNIYAATTTIGNTTTGTTANITANVALGNALTLAAANVTLNTAQQDVAQVSAGTRITGANPNTLTFAHTALNDGRLSTTATATNTTTGTGPITTNGATLNFSVAGQPWAANAGGALNAAAASSISGATGSTLVMNGSEKINVVLLGSLKNNETHTLINVATATTAQTGTPTDNSYVIDSELSRNASGDLVVTFRRDAQSYVTKSATGAHASQAAATRLGALAASGASYDADMQRVINKLDLDQWGYGNNQTNLATQVKRLAPISNGSITLSAIDAGTLALNTMGNRMASLRADNALVGVAGAEVEGRDGQWIKLVGNSSRQQAKGYYDGYSARTSGLVWGTDTRLNPDTLLGLGISATNTSVDQQDFRAGQGHTIRSYELAGYGAYQFNADVYGEASLSYANHNITGSRLTALDRMSRADYDANQITARIGLGYRHVIAEKQTLTPMINFESSRLRSDAYNETGADALSLKFKAQTVTRNRASLGLRYLSENTTAAGTVLRPELTAEVYRDNKGLSHTTTAAFAGDLTGANFTTTGVQTDRTGYKLAAGLSILTSKTMLMQLHYGYEHREGFTSRSARIKARWDF